jgi:hypothetical protein
MIKFGKGKGPGKLLCCIDSKNTQEELVINWFDFFSDKTTPEECSSLLVITPRDGPVVSRVAYIPSKADSGLSKDAILKKGKAVFAPLADCGYTLMNTAKMDDYWDGLQKMGVFSPSYYYQKGVTAAEIPRDKLLSVVEELCSYAEVCPINNFGTAIIVMPLGGALTRTTDGTTASGASYKTKKWWFLIAAEFPKGPKKPELRNKCVQWVRDVYKVLEPFAVRDSYIGREPDSHFHAYGDLFGSTEVVEKLRALKTKYDPGNVFSLNRNIAPYPN